MKRRKAKGMLRRMDRRLRIKRHRAKGSHRRWSEEAKLLRFLAARRGSILAGLKVLAMLAVPHIPSPSPEGSLGAAGTRGQIEPRE